MKKCLLLLLAATNICGFSACFIPGCGLDMSIAPLIFHFGEYQGQGKVVFESSGHMSILEKFKRIVIPGCGITSVEVRVTNILSTPAVRYQPPEVLIQYGILDWSKSYYVIIARKFRGSKGNNNC